MKTFLVHIRGRHKPLVIEADSYEITKDGFHVRFQGKKDNYPDIFSRAVDYIETVMPQLTLVKPTPARKNEGQFFQIGNGKFTRNEIETINHSLQNQPYVKSIEYKRRGAIHGFYISTDKEIDPETVKTLISKEVAKLKR